MPAQELDESLYREQGMMRHPDRPTSAPQPFMLTGDNAAPRRISLANDFGQSPRAGQEPRVGGDPVRRH